MRAALSTLRAVAEGRGARSVAVLGSMRELGATSEAEHEAVGRAAAEAGVSLLVVVGDEAAGIRTGALQVEGWAGECRTAPDADAAGRIALTQVRAGDVVLVKASRAEALERVASSLVEATVDTAGGPAAPGRSAPEDRDEGVRSR
jgi:UDP-N-acetylmuramoyl-tripeptide--D-alanyl-D-alanine ligase